MVEAREGFVLLGSRDGDIEVEEVKRRLNMRKSSHKGWRSLRLDYRHFFLIFAVINNLLLGKVVFLAISGVLEHLVDI